MFWVFDIPSNLGMTTNSCNASYFINSKSEKVHAAVSDVRHFQACKTSQSRWKRDDDRNIELTLWFLESTREWDATTYSIVDANLLQSVAYPLVLADS